MSDEDYDRLFEMLAEQFHMEKFAEFDEMLVAWLIEHPEVKVTRNHHIGRVVAVPEHMLENLLQVATFATEVVQVLMGGGGDIDGFVVDMGMMRKVNLIGAMLTKVLMIDDEKMREN